MVRGYKAGYRQSASCDFYTFSNEYDIYDLVRNSERAYKDIENAEALIDTIRLYLQDITKHAQNVINNIDFKTLITLYREESCGSIDYYVEVFNIPDIEDISENMGRIYHKNRQISVKRVERHNFSGKDRYKARDLAKELIKKYPNAIFKQNRELVKWHV